MLFIYDFERPLKLRIQAGTSLDAKISFIARHQTKPSGIMDILSEKRDRQ